MFALVADMLDPPSDGDVELAWKCARELRTFMREAWPILEPAAEFVEGWHTPVICEHLQAVSDGEILRLLINQPPRTGKSTTVSVCWPAWDWLLNPHLRWLFASYAASLSIRDSVKCRRLIQSKGGREEGTIFQRLGYQGVMALIGQTWTLELDQNMKVKYETTETGMRLATSVDGTATGEGGDRVVVDDAVGAKDARSDAKREGANQWWDETMSTRFNNPQAAGVVVQQRLHEEDLTGHLLDQGGWHHLCLPGQYEPTHKYVYPPRYCLPSGRELPGDPRTRSGELLEPVRLGGSKLIELRRSLGSYGYAGQIQQLPSPAEGGRFRRDWWKRWRPARRGDEGGGEMLPAAGHWDRIIASWDMRFSDSEKASSSYVVGQVWGCKGADRYLLAQIRARLGFPDTLKAVKALQAYRPASAKLVEQKANGAAVIQTLRREVPGLIPIEPEGGKDVRAAAVEPTVEAGNVFLPASDFIPCPPGYEPTLTVDFIEEFASFPNGTHDDQVDALSQALNWIDGKAVTVTAPPKAARRQRSTEDDFRPDPKGIRDDPM